MEGRRDGLQRERGKEGKEREEIEKTRGQRMDAGRDALLLILHFQDA